MRTWFRFIPSLAIMLFLVAGCTVPRKSKTVAQSDARVGSALLTTEDLPPNWDPAPLAGVPGNRADGCGSWLFYAGRAPLGWAEASFKQLPASTADSPIWMTEDLFVMDATVGEALMQQARAGLGCPTRVVRGETYHYAPITPEVNADDVVAWRTTHDQSAVKDRYAVNTIVARVDSVVVVVAQSRYGDAPPLDDAEHVVAVAVERSTPLNLQRIEPETHSSKLSPVGAAALLALACVLDILAIVVWRLVRPTRWWLVIVAATVVMFGALAIQYGSVSGALVALLAPPILALIICSRTVQDRFMKSKQQEILEKMYARNPAARDRLKRHPLLGRSIRKWDAEQETRDGN